MLKVDNLGFGYSGIPIFEGVSFRVKKGSLCGLFGPNGSGKTTLFKCCMSFLKYDNGSICIDGCDVKRKKIGELAKLVAYVPQEHKPPFPYLVKEVVLMGRTPHMGGIFGVSEDDKSKVMEALEMLEISHIADKPYNQLSGGQRQLVLIARAMAQETPLMLLDEPTSALDFCNQIRIWNILKKISAKGTTILACSHDPNHISWFCDDVIVMYGGGLVAKGNPKSVVSEELLSTIFSDICSVGYMDRLMMVYPKNIQAECPITTINNDLL
ncbi:TPA: ABC transporter ATP-binding protein [Methanosarcina acetivorans]|uniref:Cobalamin import ATP-binding protein BtuD n=2 Tax=Methanosarcina acetivorans TaxID=2214 RepID=Q8TRP3_METAC|nr:ABC transporter ATP-binding protein [Methanosarcina acetivorans]AAM04553.1 iron ABC transporter, ATP-binding protein [Methanosarcina acetivorans C2A]HIH93818.1 ABC transporter ATP-binding protein [Methanosarcina acetivorans]